MKRYPGIRPFNTDESDRFFGRDQDIERLWRLIRLEQVVILYGKSGYGKSSLLSAGIYPKLAPAAEADTPIGKRYQHWEIRFGPYQGADSRPPLETLRSQIIRSGEPSSLFPADQFGATLWQALKSRQTAAGKRFILFFDQFEEIFTYPPEQVAAFKKQLAEALYTAVPDAVADAHLGPEQEDALNDPFELKVVFAIRADRMSQLNALQDYLPNLLRHSYPLDALDEQQATAAITAPALLVDEGDAHFDTPPFHYDSAALMLIFKELRDATTGKIETSALQIVCRHVEDNIVGPDAGALTTLKKLSTLNPKRTISAADLGDIKSIFREFYDRTVAALPAAQQPAARRLVEDILIKDGIRLPFAEQALLAEPGVTADLLQTLTAASLLRVERDEQGRMLYEVGHDTLVGPISEAAKARRDQEEKERLQREAEEALSREEEAIRREQETERKRRRALWLAVGAGILAVVAIIASLIAVRENSKAGREADKARAQTVIAEKKQAEADSSANLAQRKQSEADASAAVALRRENEARIAEEKASVALRQAEGNAQIAVRVLLQQAQNAIYHLQYRDALTSLNAAAKLGQQKPDIARGLLELAFFYTETNDLFEARHLTQAAATLLGQTLAPIPADAPGGRLALRAQLEGLDAKHLRSLEARYYYPDMITVAAGSFFMGSDSACEDCGNDEKPRHLVSLPQYQMASKETTFFQFALYAAAAGRKFTDFSPSWGLDGDNPVVNVSWFDAVLYANWLSNRLGLDSAYVVGEKTKGGYGDQYAVTLRPQANGYRLPTESEWEYAAKGGPVQQTFRYAGSDSLDLAGWFYENCAIDGVTRTHPVGKKQKNTINFFDLTGNVWEWCWDWYDPYPLGSVDNWRGPDKGDDRVGRGGSWLDGAGLCRAAYRSLNGPTGRNSYIGFRLARSFPLGR